MTSVFFILFGLVGILGVLAVAVFFMLNLQKTIASCSRENQAMDPAMVWLLLIPLFNFYWLFHVVMKIRDSLTKEYQARSLDLAEVNESYNIGLWYAIVSCISIVPILGWIASIAGIVLFIMYWIKTAEIRKKLVFNL